MTSVASQQPIEAPLKPLIAHVIFRLDVGGMENGLVNLINNLPNDRYRHAIICLTESTDFEKRIDADNVVVYQLHKREGKDLLFYLRFWRLIRRLRPAVLHTRNLGTLDLVLLAILARVPVRIHGEHGWDVSDLRGQSVKYRLLRKVCDLAITEYVAVSRDIASWLREMIGVQENRVRQIYNGVDIETFCPQGDRASLPFREAHNGTLIIGTVGRMDPIKNFDRLIAAIAKLLGSDPSLRHRLSLVMIGDGPRLAEYRNRVTELGLEEFAWLPGTKDNISELLRSMHVFVLPSRNEGISNTILEAMATALPVIASDVGGNPELVLDGETGLLIAANDTGAISDAIDRYFRSPGLIESHGQAARERAVKLFSLRTMVQSYAELYDRLLRSSAIKRIH